MTSTMPIPEWAADGELRSQMKAAMGQESVAGRFQPENLNRVDNYSTFFAEWDMKDQTVLLHIFPRAGAEDVWSEGYYLPRCRRCRKELPRELAASRKPCPACGHTGLIYVPGRNEEGNAKVHFPTDVLTRVKRAVDEVWEGNVAIEPVKELGAAVVQFQDVNLKEERIFEMLEKFFDEFDRQME